MSKYRSHLQEVARRGVTCFAAMPAADFSEAVALYAEERPDQLVSSMFCNQFLREEIPKRIARHLRSNASGRRMCDDANGLLASIAVCVTYTAIAAEFHAIVQSERARTPA